MLKLMIASGDPVVAQDLQSIFKSFINPGVVKGFDLFVVNNNTLGLAAGTALTDSGVFVVEDEVRNLTITQTVAAKDYTVVYTYTASKDFGGGPASLQIINGLLNEDTFSNGVILGWVKYTGGSAALSSDMLISNTKINLGKPLEAQKNNFQSELAPLSTKWVRHSVTTGVAASLAVNENFDSANKAIVTEVVNIGATLVAASYLVPFSVPALGAGQLMVDFYVGSGAGVTFEILTETGALITPTTNVPIFTNKAMGQAYLQIPKHNDLTSGKLFYVKINVSLQPTYNVKFKRVGISSYMEPV